VKKKSLSVNNSSMSFFVLIFSTFQILILNDVYSFRKSIISSVVLFSIPIFRGICDIIENIILLRIVCTYPRINETAISICNTI